MNLATLSLIAALPAGTAVAATYSDADRDIFDGSLTNLDIVSVEVQAVGSDIVIDLTLANLNANWGNYMMFINTGTTADGSGPIAGNGWGRSIDGLSSTHMIGGWLNSNQGQGGAQFWKAANDSWALSSVSDNEAGSISQFVNWETSTITWTLDGFVEQMIGGNGVSPLSFSFEIATTGSGDNDPAIDLLGGEGVQPGWGQGSTSTDYQVFSIPAPGTLALLGLAGLTGRRRRR